MALLYYRSIPGDLLQTLQSVVQHQSTTLSVASLMFCSMALDVFLA